MDAVIQAGGRGERIRSAAGSAAKPMLRVGKEPMIARLVRQIAASGARRIAVVIPAGHGEFRAFLQQLARSLSSGELDLIEEREPLGNAGALGMLKFGREPLLFCFGDLVTDLSFERMVRLHRERGCDITLASHYQYHQLSLGELNTEGERVCGYVEKPRKQFLICSGIAVFEPRALEIARTLAAPFGLVDLVNAALQAGCSVTHWLHQAYWIDVNTPELLEQARNDASRCLQQSVG
jgi:NDP-sugar pyrophosphorylase family protein